MRLETEELYDLVNGDRIFVNGKGKWDTCGTIEDIKVVDGDLKFILRVTDIRLLQFHYMKNPPFGYRPYPVYIFDDDIEYITYKIKNNL